jgi:hypothetical protein
MQERQIRIATVLVSLLTALLLLHWLWTPAEELDPEATSPVWEVTAADLVRVEVQRPDGMLVLDRSGGRWALEAPLEDVADQRQVDYLLGELERVEKGVPIPDADPEDFGLGPEPLVVVTVTEEDGETQTLHIGKEAPVGWRTYVRAADGSVAAVAGIVGKRLQMDIDDLRETTVIQYGIGDVTRATVESAEGTLVVHGEGDRWWVEGWTRADPEKVDDLLVGLREVRFDSFFVDTAPEGIGDPGFRVTVETIEETVGFEVGESGPPGVYVRTFSGRVGWIHPERLALLGQGPTDVGDPDAFPLDPDTASSVEVDFGGRVWSGTREEDVWTAEGAEPPAPEAAVEALGLVPITYRREPGPPLAESWGSVLVQMGEDDVRAVDIGQVVEDRWRVAVDRDGGSPYLISIEALDAAAKVVWRQ